MGAHDSSSDGMLGRAIGNFIIERRLGQGGMGTVYLAHHAELPNTNIAVKVLAVDDETKRVQATKRFRQEAIAAAAVGDHRVVKPIDMGRLTDGTLYILMEYVSGRSLADVLRESGPMSVEMALKIAYRVADSMALAHHNGIVHRDLKPSNVMLSDRSEVRILDFGIARASGTSKLVDTSDTAMLGTPGYMSPEAAAALGTDGRTDVFSLGVMLFQMLTGELPFAAPSKQDAIANVLTATAPPVGSLRPAQLDAVPPGVEALIARALTRSRDGRVTMAELRRMLLDELRALPALADIVQRPISEVAPHVDSPRDAPTLSGREAEVVALLSAAKGDSSTTSELPARRDSQGPVQQPQQRREVLGEAAGRRRRRWIGAVVSIVALAAIISAGVLVRLRVRRAVVANPASEKFDPGSSEKLDTASLYSSSSDQEAR